MPEDRRAAVAAVRDAVNRALPAGYEEGIAYGMIGWHVPHRLYPAGYHCDPKQPLPFAGLASQKGHMSLHLMAVYLDPPRRDAFVRADVRAITLNPRLAVDVAPTRQYHIVSPIDTGRARLNVHIPVTPVC